MRILSVVVALSLVSVVLIAPAGVAETQEVHVHAEGSEDGATVTVATEGDLAEESVTVTVPPDEAPGVPSPPDDPVDTIIELCNDQVKRISQSLTCF